MLKKLNSTFNELVAAKKVKSRWSEIESYGIADMINYLWQEQEGYGSIAHSVIVENKLVHLNLYEGVTYKYEDKVYRLVKAYLDSDDNIIFLSVNNDVFLYEAEHIDAEEFKHYVGLD